MPMLPDEVKVNALRKERKFTEVKAPRYERYKHYLKKAEQAEAQLDEHSVEFMFLESSRAPSVQPSGASSRAPSVQSSEAPSVQPFDAALWSAADAALWSASDAAIWSAFGAALKSTYGAALRGTFGAALRCSPLERC